MVPASPFRRPLCPVPMELLPSPRLGRLRISLLLRSLLSPLFGSFIVRASRSACKRSLPAKKSLCQEARLDDFRIGQKAKFGEPNLRRQRRNPKLSHYFL